MNKDDEEIINLEEGEYESDQNKLDDNFLQNIELKIQKKIAELEKSDELLRDNSDKESREDEGVMDENLREAEGVSGDGIQLTGEFLEQGQIVMNEEVLAHSQNPQVEEVLMTGESQVQEQMLTGMTGDVPAQEQMLARMTGESQVQEQMLARMTEESPAQEQMLAGMTGESPAQEQMLAGMTAEIPAQEHISEAVAGITGEIPVQEQMTEGITRIIGEQATLSDEISSMEHFTETADEKEELGGTRILPELGKINEVSQTEEKDIDLSNTVTGICVGIAQKMENEEFEKVDVESAYRTPVNTENSYSPYVDNRRTAQTASRRNIEEKHAQFKSKMDSQRRFKKTFINTLATVLFAIMMGAVAFIVIQSTFKIEEEVVVEEKKDVSIIAQVSLDKAYAELMYYYNNGELQSAFLEIFDSNKMQYDYVTIPVNTKIKLTEETYTKVEGICGTDTIGESVILKDIFNKVSKEKAYEIGQIIIGDLIGRKVSFYTAMDKSLYVENYTKTNKTYKDANGKEYAAKVIVCSDVYVSKNNGFDERGFKTYFTSIYDNIETNLTLNNRIKYIDAYVEADISKAEYWQIIGVESGGVFIVDVDATTALIDKIFADNANFKDE